MMPLYEYVCSACGTSCERLRKSTEREGPLACPACDQPARRILSAAAVHGSSAKAEPAPFCESGPACCGGGCAMN